MPIANATPGRVRTRAARAIGNILGLPLQTFISYRASIDRRTVLNDAIAGTNRGESVCADDYLGPKEAERISEVIAFGSINGARGVARRVGMRGMEALLYGNVRYTRGLRPRPLEAQVEALQYSEAS